MSANPESPTPTFRELASAARQASESTGGYVAIVDVIDAFGNVLATRLEPSATPIRDRATPSIGRLYRVEAQFYNGQLCRASLAR